MNSPTLGLRVASVLFGAMGLAQLLRVVIRPEILVAGRRNAALAKCPRGDRPWRPLPVALEHRPPAAVVLRVPVAESLG